MSGLTNNQAVRAEAKLYEENGKKAHDLLQKLKPDIVGIQEIDFNSKRSYYTDQIDPIRGETFGWAATAINWDKRYVPFPYWPISVHFGEMLSGQAILSRYPIIETQRWVLEKPAGRPFYYNAFYLDRLAQVAKVTIENRELIIINIHLEAFHMETRKNQAKEVLKIYQSYKDLPVLLIGDFNSLPPQATIKSDFKDEPEANFNSDTTMLSFLETPGLTEACPFGDYKKDETATFTFPSDEPTRRLDYIFYNDKLKRVSWRVVKEAGSTSDHLPVVMEFQFKE